MTTETTSHSKSYWEEKIFVYCGGRVDKCAAQNIVNVRIADVGDDDFIGDKNNDGEETSATTTSAARTTMTTTTEAPSPSSKKKKNKKNHIADYAFNCSTNLVTINFPKSIESIGVYSFRCCTKLTSVDLQSTSVRTVGFGAFFGCSSLEELYLSEQTEEIGEFAFKGCTSLRSIQFPPLTRSIRKGSFERCTALTIVDLQSAKVQTIGAGAFCLCASLSTIKLSDHTTEIGDNAFYKCTSLVTVNLPTSSTKIGASSFYFCTELTSINLRSTSIHTIGSYAFYGCSKLSTLSYSSNESAAVTTTTTTTNGYNNDDDTSISIYSTKLPSSLVKVGTSAFRGCVQLPSILSTNMIHFECDLNRGGRLFLQRRNRNGINGTAGHHHINKSKNNTNDGQHHRHRQTYDYYPSALWPLILYRIMNEMILPNQKYRRYDDNVSSYTEAFPIRRASVVYYLMTNGIAMDILVRCAPKNK